VTKPYETQEVKLNEVEPVNIAELHFLIYVNYWQKAKKFAFVNNFLWTRLKCELHFLIYVNYWQKAKKFAFVNIQKLFVDIEK
jgi:hypothetical protein